MQWLMLVGTFVVMAVLQRLARGGPLEARATLALGFLALVAYLAGTIAQRLRLPRIVGYLLAGLVAGPAWLRLVHADELQVLAPISSGALSLIAFAVGLELTAEVLRRDRRRTVGRIVAGAIAIPFAAVTLVVLTVSPWFPLTAHQPFRDALVVALSLGTLAAVSSPTLTWSVINDLGAQGPLSRTTLDVSIVQDIVAVLLVIVIVAIAVPIASPGAVTPGIAGSTLLVFGGSLVAGVALGLAAAQYLRAIRGQLALVLVIFAFVAVQAVRLLGLDPVLLALAAGCALRNTAPEHGDRVRAELKRCAIPVYVVFFALAGSNLQLDVLAEVWPWALLLTGLRIAGLRGGLRWAGSGKQPAVGADWVNYGWLGLVPQGGLAITLAAVLRRAFPEWNVSLEALLLAMIGVQQLAGPICFQWVLQHTGELTHVSEGSHDRETPGTTEHPGPSGIVVAGGRM